MSCIQYTCVNKNFHKLISQNQGRTQGGGLGLNSPCLIEIKLIFVVFNSVYYRNALEVKSRGLSETYVLQAVSLV